MARLLLVDDNDFLRGIIAEYLEEFGHAVTEATNGETALAAFQANTFDLLITDIIMPQMDGLELIKAVRKTDEDIKIIAISGGGATLDAGPALHWSHLQGAQQILAKPFQPSALTAMLNELLNDSSEPERLFA